MVMIQLGHMDDEAKIQQGPFYDRGFASHTRSIRIGGRIVVGSASELFFWYVIT